VQAFLGVFSGFPGDPARYLLLAPPVTGKFFPSPETGKNMPVAQGALTVSRVRASRRAVRLLRARYSARYRARLKARCPPVACAP
jgi:hypothetical protein